VLTHDGQLSQPPGKYSSNSPIEVDKKLHV
jgi:hypothetical protein